VPSKHEVTRLKRELVILIVTVGRDGHPHAVPVWFWWYGESFLIYAVPGQKVRAIQANPNGRSRKMTSKYPDQPPQQSYCAHRRGGVASEDSGRDLHTRPEDEAPADDLRRVALRPDLAQRERRLAQKARHSRRKRERTPPSGAPE